MKKTTTQKTKKQSVRTKLISILDINSLVDEKAIEECVA